MESKSKSSLPCSCRWCLSAYSLFKLVVDSEMDGKLLEIHCFIKTAPMATKTLQYRLAMKHPLDTVWVLSSRTREGALKPKAKNPVSTAEKSPVLFDRQPKRCKRETNIAYEG